MKKLTKKQWISIAILGLMGFGGFGIYQYTQVERISEKEIQLTNFENDTINQFAIKQNNQVVNFIRKDGKWYNEVFPSVAYNQELLMNSINALKNLKGKQAIFNAKEPGEYGISEDAVVIAFKTLGGMDEKFVIGSRIGDQKAYYVWSETKEVIGIIDEKIIEPFMQDNMYWIEHEISLPSIEEVKKIKMTQGENTLLDVAKQEDKWMMNAPFEDYSLQEEKIEAYYKNSLTTIEKQGFIGDSTNNLGAYGLDVPQSVIYVNDEKYMTFGAENKDGIYMTFKEEPYVYQIALQQYKMIKEEQVEKWLTGIIYQVDPLMIEGIAIQVLDQAYTIEGELLTNEALLQKLFDLKVSKKLSDGSIEENNPREAEVSIVYTLKDGTIKTIEFIPYDPSFYLLRKDGKVEFGADKKQIVQLVTLIEELFKKE